MKRNQFLWGNKKGMSLLEVLIALGLICTICAVLMSVEILYVKHYKAMADKIEIQQQGTVALNYIAKELRRADDIEGIKDKKDGSINHINKSMPIKIWSIHYVVINKTYNITRYKKFVLKDNNKLFLDNTEIADYIKSMTIMPVPKGYTYANARALEIVMVLEKEGEKYVVEKTIYFRNKS